MRMWMVNPKIMCRKHLLGEHVELHMFLGTLRKGVSINGYLANKLFEPTLLWKRHEALVEEMLRRGYNHNSPMDSAEVDNIFMNYSIFNTNLWSIKNIVDGVKSLNELTSRCQECRGNWQIENTLVC